MTSKLAKDPAKYFIRRDVQELLIKVTGFDLSKIFKPDFNPELKNSEIQLLTQSQLELEQQKALEKAKQLIQMPPFLKPRERSDVVLDKDERLNPLNLKNTKYMFIDISLNIPDHKRTVLVREANGVLRKADYSEKEKMLDVYYPKPARSLHVPPMFQDTHLEKCLENKKYLLLLKTACNVFEPNDPDFIGVTHRVYEYVNEAQDFEILRSTRFFGPLVFYLVWYKKLDNLIAHAIKTKASLDDECIDYVRLYLTVHGSDAKTTSLINERTSVEKIVQTFIKNDLSKGAAAEIALVDYLKSAGKKPQSARN